MTNLLFLSFYYRPDLCAGSFRATPLVNALSKLAGTDVRIEVLTTWPNRYATFAEDCAETEQIGNVSVRRIKLPAHRSDMVGQSRGFYTFAKEVNKLTRGKHYDMVFATSSRLLTASLGAWVARKKRARLYLDIRDIFADTIGEIMPQPAAFFAGSFFGLVERLTMRRAVNINLVSRGFEPYFRKRYPDKSFTWITNGIDPEFIDASESVAVSSPGPDVPTVLYAGNVGEGQCLHEIIPQLARALEGKANFIVIGDGGRRQQLADAIAAAGVCNVELQPPVGRERLIEQYREADVLFLHLGAYRAFEKVLPSKLFEYGAMGKPILAGVSGFSARFVNEELSNSGVFTPCDVDDAVRAFESLRLADSPRPQFVQKYSRENLSTELARDILDRMESTA